MKLLFRLLRKGGNPLHLAWFALANLVGAVIVLLGIQAYKDAGVVLGASDSALESDILVLSKPVSTATTLANALGSGPRAFNEREIQEIAESFTAEKTIEILDQISLARERISANVAPLLALEAMMVALRR